MQLWEGVLARRREFRLFPDERLPLSEYHDPDPAVPDKTYCPYAGVIDGFAFDWVGKRIPRTTFETTDVAQWLALEVALRTMEDAGYCLESLPLEKTGVVLGNTLTGEQSRTSHMRARWPFVRKSIRSAAQARGLDRAVTEDLVETVEEYYKSVFPVYSEDIVAGMLANTIAGRVANFLDIHGGGFTVDGACASSLVAITNAADALTAGDVDLVFAGGVDIALDTFEMIGFSKLGALSKTEITPFDRRADGFTPGEGCGMVALKRWEDARRDGDRVYAVLRGWGISSDGRGGISAPSAAGQARAIERALARVGTDFPLDFVECHGTGTRVGDRVELTALASVYGGEAAPRSIGVSSVKSVIGHTKAAAGAAGFIKAALAVNRRVLPPTANVSEPNPVFEDTAQAFYPLRTGEQRAPSDTLRAGVSAFGFGGINAHVLLESGDAPASSVAPAVDERALLASAQESELFVLSGASAASVRRRLGELRTQATGMSVGELVDLSARLTDELDAGPVRAAFLANRPEELLDRIDVLDLMLADPDAGLGVTAHPRDPVWVGRTDGTPRVGFVFPGQGSQRLNAARLLVERFAWARELAEAADRVFAQAGTPGVLDALWHPLDREWGAEALADRDAQLARTQLAQPAIVLSSVLWAGWLTRLGITPEVTLGHSLGELTALHIAGALSPEELFQTVAVRGQAMAADFEEAGAMASLGCDQDRAEGLLATCTGYAVVANLNSPSQTVISGDRSAVAQAVERAKEDGIPARLLPVSNAFHSRLVAAAGDRLAAEARLPGILESPVVRVLSSMKGAEIEPGMDVRSHLVRQVVTPVDFLTAIRRLTQACDVVIEVGPGRVLSDLITRTTDGRLPAAPVESRAGADRDWNAAVARAFVHGVDVSWAAFFEGRLVRPFTPAAEKVFITNYCERPFQVDEAAIAAAPRLSAGSALVGLPGLSAQSLDDYLGRRGHFLAEVVRADLGGGAASRGTPSPSSTPKPAHPQRTTAPPMPAPVPVAAARTAEAALIALVVDRTGYTADRVLGSSKLQDDLNLDSIKSGEVIGSLAREFGAAGQVDPVALANATIAEIAQAIERVAAPRSPAPEEHPPRPAATASVEDVLIDQVVERTGYTRESIASTARLLDDLHLDSIKSGEIIAAAATALAAGGAVDPVTLANASISEIAAALQAASPPAALLTPPGPAPVPGQRPEPAELLAVAITERTGYPRGTIGLGQRLGDDLNLDSIKAGEILAQVARSLEISSGFDPAAYANSTVAEAADAMGRLLPAFTTVVAPRVAERPAAPAPQTPPAGFSASAQRGWVRDFVIDYVEQPAPAAVPQDWTTADACILSTDDESGIGAALAAQLRTRGATVRQMTYAQAEGEDLGAESWFSHLFAVLPEPGEAEQPPLTAPDRLREAIGRLRSIALAPAAPGGRPPTTVTYVQSGGGHFGHEGPAVPYEQVSAYAFAASLHLERPDLRVRVVDLPAEGEPARLAACVAAECGSTEAFVAAGYDADLVRRVPRPRSIGKADWQRRGLRWHAEDVMLVTGGARGITAELALAAAKGLRLRTALVGSSPFTPDDTRTAAGAEIARTLQRFAAEGLTARYFSCDLTDPEAVRALVQRIDADFGTVAAVVHGAALNKPRPVYAADRESVLAETAPKILGAANLCEALAAKPPKLLIGLSSVLELTGMAGNSWYSFSNEALTLIVRRFAADHPGTTGLTIPFTVWDEVGMGHRMGSVAHLAKLGVLPVRPSDASAHFLRTFNHDPGADRLAIASRVGLPTWRPSPAPVPTTAPARRFLERIVFEEPGVEVIARASLDLGRDRYLTDHTFRGTCILPTVFGLEAMAQAVARVTGRAELGPLVIENVRLDRPIAVSAGAATEIEIRAEMQEAATGPLQVAVTIGTEQSGFSVPHFSATFVLDAPGAAQTLPVPADGSALPISPSADLYGNVLFQGPLFQRIESLHELSRAADATGVCVFRADCTPRPAGLEGLEGSVLLGDAYFNDTLLQSFQLVAGARICLPVRIDRVEVHEPGGPAAWGRTEVASFADGRASADIRALDEAGRVLLRLVGAGFRQAGTSGLRRSTEVPSAALGRSVLFDQVRRLGVQLPGIEITTVPGLSAEPRNRRHDRELALVGAAVSDWKGRQK